METNLTVEINMGESYIYAPSFQHDDTPQVSAKLTTMGEDLGQ